MPVDLARAKELFLAALDVPAPERAALLERACGDDHELRRRIEAMLQTHENSGELLPRAPSAMLAEGGVAVGGMTDGGVTDAGATAAFPQQSQPVTRVDATSSDADGLSFLSPASTPGHLGRLGHYEVQEVIGKGGFGVVLKAFDERLHRVVAIKVLSPAYAASGSARKRFIREARAAAAVKNEHVVGIHDVQEDAQPPYLVMECIDGISLQDKLDRHGPLEVKEMLRIGMQIAEGLAAAHKQGLVHRDIKPSNILLENGVERVKITYFGLARAVDDASVTQSGVVAGTPMYMSPEQAEGLPVDHRSDLFSLGTVLYALCTGHSPFRASGTHAVLKRVIDASPRPIREVNNEIPEWLSDIIGQLHAKKSEERFQTAREVAELLGQRLAAVQAGREVPSVRRGSAAAAAERDKDIRSGVSAESGDPGDPGDPRRAVAVGQRRIPGTALAAVAVLILVPLYVSFVLRPERFSGHGWPWLIGAFGLAALLAGFLLLVQSRRRRIAGALAGILAGLVLSSPFVYRSLTDQGTLTYSGTIDANIERILIKRDGEVVADLITKHGTIQLPAGDYEAEITVKDGYELAKYRVGPFSHLANTPGALGWQKAAGGTFPLTLTRDFHVGISLELAKTIDRSYTPKTEPGWVQLFNGKDHKEWDFIGPYWKVADGTLRTTQNLSVGWLHTKRDYADFELELEYRLAPGAKSAVFLRGWLQGDIHGSEFLAIQLIDDWASGMIGKLNGTASIVDVVAAKQRVDTKPKSWHMLAIKVQGRRIQVVHDGVRAQDVNLDDYPEALKRIPGLTKKTGRIGLQNFGTLAEFRNIRIKELSPEKPAWVQLFNGKDLTGWTPHARLPNNWKVENGILVGRSPNSYLFRDGFGKSFHLRAETRINDGGYGAIIVHTSSELRSNNSPFGCWASINSTEKSGYKTGVLSCVYLNWPVFRGAVEKLPRPNEWFVLDVLSQDGLITVKVDGKNTSQVDIGGRGGGSNHIALGVGNQGSVVEFKSIAFKELPAKPATGTSGTRN
ncbi:MAG: DUF1080 domain-containing protein [Planctomycetes bacterium]|nr:DUF1080 domain-containing protein [Planctomycetota bacterium]